MTGRAYCAATSREVAEPLAGTASTVRAFLLLEHGGPWGRSVLQHATFPDGVREGMRELCARHGVRGMLMRRPGSGPGVPDRPRVLLSVTRPDGGVAAERRLDDVTDVAALPLASLLAELRAGRVPAGWTGVEDFLGTCTHGRHDACCAEYGRPVARALHDLAGDAAWEVSHVGGDRFAGNVLALPEGLYYGHVTPADAADLVAARRSGQLLTRLLRGRSSLPFAAQAAEIALRRHLGLEQADAVHVLEVERSEHTVRSGHAVPSVQRTTTTWSVRAAAAPATWRVVVETAHPGPPRPLTCTGEASLPPVHTVVELAATDAPGRGMEGWDAAYAARAAADRPVGDLDPLLVGLLADLPPGRALDVAAGTGPASRWLAAHGWQVTAVDFSAEAVALARRADAEAGVDVDWVVADARVWQPPPGSPGFDLVLVVRAALPDVVARAGAWLAPGGRLVVVGHSRANLAIADAPGPRDPRLLHDPDSLRRLAGDLEVERCEEVDRRPEGGRGVDVVLVARRR